MLSSSQFPGGPPSDYDAASKLDLEEIFQDLISVYSRREQTDEPELWLMTREDELTEWHRWYLTNYPATDPQWLAEKHGSSVDLRVLFMAYPDSAYSVLLFLDACYEVDKALCGTDKVALETVKMWHRPFDFTAYTYILSEEMILWWKTELCRVSNEIRNVTASKISSSIRIRGVLTAYQKFRYIEDDDDTIGTRIMTVIGECGGAPPVNLLRRIHERWNLLMDSVDILRRELYQAMLEELPVAETPRQLLDAGGLRQRRTRRSEQPLTPDTVPSISYPEDITVPQNPNHTSTSIANYIPPSLLPADIRNNSHFTHALDLLTSHPKLRTCITFLAHEETSFVLFAVLIVISAVFMAISTKLAGSTSDSTSDSPVTSTADILANASQTVLSILSLYLMVIPVVRSRTLDIKHPSWFWTCLVISSGSSILGTGVSGVSSTTAVVLEWIGTFAQVVITMLLTQSIRSTSTAESVDDIELHTN